MILLRQKLYANVTPLYLAKRATQGKQGLQTAVDAEKKQLEAVIERYKSLHGGKDPSKRLVRRKLGQINDSRKFLERSVKSGIEAGIPEQYAEQSVLGNFVGQHRIGKHDTLKRGAKRWLAKKERIDALNQKAGMEWSLHPRLDVEPNIKQAPSFERHFLDQRKAQEDAAKRLRRIMKAREPYLPQSVIDQRVGEALSTKRSVGSDVENTLFNLRGMSEYLTKEQAELSTMNLLTNPSRPPKPRLMVAPRLQTLGVASNQSWRRPWATI